MKPVYRSFRIDLALGKMAPAVLALAAIISLPVFGQPSTTADGESSEEKAEGAHAKPELPSGETIMEWYLEATGGREAHEKHYNSVTEAVYARRIQYTAYAAKPDKQSINFIRDGQVVDRRGTDGLICWRLDSRGDQLLTGDQAAEFMNDAIFDPVLNWREVYKSVECVTIGDVDNTRCYEVKAVTMDGRTITMYFDYKTHVLKMWWVPAYTAEGTKPLKTYLTEYTDVDGVKIPFETERTLLNSHRHLSIKSVRFNAEIPADAFTPPGELANAVSEPESSE